MITARTNLNFLYGISVEAEFVQVWQSGQFVDLSDVRHLVSMVIQDLQLHQITQSLQKKVKTKCYKVFDA